jgi:hypothetical protein
VKPPSREGTTVPDSGVRSIDVDEESRALTIETDIEFIDTIFVGNPVGPLFSEYEKVFSDILFWVDEE